jgi:uncharacterized protein
MRCLLDDELDLILMPTEACNFRCTYCYETFAHGRMRAPVVNGIKRLIHRRIGDLRALQIGWFGGEPLLAIDIIDDVMLWVQGLATFHPGVRVTSSMSTNGYTLTQPHLRRLLDLGVRGFQVSLDGPAECHDRTRVKANGGGTFERIWSNLLAAREVAGDFGVTVRLHVHRENAPALPAFIAEYARCFASDRRFRLNLRCVEALGGPQDATFPVLNASAREAVLAPLRDVASAHDVAMLAAESVPVCYAARGNSFVVRADGRLNKCTVALEAPHNQVGVLHEDGTMDLDVRLMGGWIRGALRGDPTALECPIRGWKSEVH